MEKIKKTGISKFGPYLQLEDNSFKSCTEQVNKFLSNRCPCEIEVEATSGEGRDEKVSKVKVLSQSGMTVGQEMRLDKQKEDDRQRIASVCVSYAKDLAVSDTIKVEEIADKARGFMALIEELASGKVPEIDHTQPAEESVEEPEPEFDSGVSDEGEI